MANPRTDAHLDSAHIVWSSTGYFVTQSRLLRRQANAALGGMAYILDASIEVLRLVIKYIPVQGPCGCQGILRGTVRTAPSHSIGGRGEKGGTET